MELHLDTESSLGILAQGRCWKIGASSTVVLSGQMRECMPGWKGLRHQGWFSPNEGQLQRSLRADWIFVWGVYSEDGVGLFAAVAVGRIRVSTQQVKQENIKLPIKSGEKKSPSGHSNSSICFPERFFILHPCRFSRRSWIKSWATWSDSISAPARIRGLN